MGVRESHGDATGTPEAVDKGFATLDTLKWVAKNSKAAVNGGFDPYFIGRVCLFKW